MKALVRTGCKRSALVISALFSFVLAIPQARAQLDNATPCALRGVAQVATDTPVYAADGRAIARFGGAESALVASAFPADSKGRVKVETGTGVGSFKIRGLVDLERIPVFTAQNLPVIAGHVWISAERRVSVLGAAPGRLKVQRIANHPLEQTFSAWGPCSAFALSARTPSAWAVPGQARGYVLKQSRLDLYDGGGSGSSLLTTLTRAASADGVLFFSEEQTAAWVHVTYHGDVLIDAWAKLSDLQALPRGETMDQLHPTAPQKGAPRLAIQVEPRVVKTTREVALRVAAKDMDPIVGVIEPGTETYVLDVMAGWASVMPKALNVIPVENGQFWVKASELGI